MKNIFVLILFTSYIFAEVQVEGFVGVDSQYYSNSKQKHSHNITLEQQLKLKHEKENFSWVLEVFAQEDNTDFSNKKDNDRSFVRINEAYIQYEDDNSKILLGKNIRFWGALEVRNIVDVFNITDGRSDPFKTDKIGAYNLSYSHYFEDSELSIIAKLYEQKTKTASQPYVYSILYGNTSLKNSLETEKSKYRPSVYLNYNGSLYGDEYSLDYAFIYQNGYDSQRYFTRFQNEYTQHSYLVNKFLTYNTLVYDSTLYKLEALYTDVIDNENVSDYMHLALGVEHTLDSLDNGHEIGLIAEYYYYNSFDEKKSNDLTLSEALQNDLFLGFRYNFNDVEDSNAVGGVILDEEYGEQAYYLEYETRVYDMFKIKFDYRYFEASSTHNTVYSRLNQDQRVAFNISYHF